MPVNGEADDAPSISVRLDHGEWRRLIVDGFVEVNVRGSEGVVQPVTIRRPNGPASL
jgi:hypothetical protein